MAVDAREAKPVIEVALGSDPENAQLRHAYFDCLLKLSRTHVGLAWARLPGFEHPLFFRCGTSDILNLLQIFQSEEYAAVVPHDVGRILDLGAYVGYAAVSLARRFPAASLLSVEPSAANYRILQMNTLPYCKISTINAGVWNKTGRLTVASRDSGDWGTMLQESADQGVACYAVPDLLAMKGWPSAELVKCDIEGSEIQVFSDPNTPWLAGVQTLAIETHDRMVPGCSDAVAACFPASAYDHRRSGELDIFSRRQVRQARPGPPARVKLLHAEPGLLPIEPRSVKPETWTFFLFDDSCCQLHPNQPGEAPAQLAMTVELAGQRSFSARVRIANPASYDVVFSILIATPGDGRVVFSAQRTVAAATPQTWLEPLPAISGTVQVILQVEMAEGAPHCGFAWAQWLDPVIG